MQNGKTRILVVEDEIIVATDLQYQLEDLGYEVVGVAADGKSALSLAASEKPDLVLVDIHIRGDMDGIELAAQLNGGKRRPVVVFLTAFADDATLERASATQPTGYLVKPYNCDDLRATLTIGLHRAQREQAMDESEGEAVKTLAAIRMILDDEHSTPKRADAAAEFNLSPREEEVLQLLIRGSSVRRISEHLTISEHTVRNHLKTLFRKCDVHSQLELVSKVLEPAIR